MKEGNRPRLHLVGSEPPQPDQPVIAKYGTEDIERYANPKNWEIWDAPAGHEAMYQTFPEFTCLCPRSGYPDFAKVHLVTVPDKKVLEMKNLKMWLNSYRNVGISHENATQEIVETLGDTLDLNYGFILMEYTPRGNLTTFPMREYVPERNRAALDPDLKGAIRNALHIKRTLIDNIMERQLAR